MTDFLTWWFDVHWFWSTVLTSTMTFVWCIWKGEVVRGVVAFLLMGGLTSMRMRRGTEES